MDGGGSGEDPGKVVDNGCKDEKDETSIIGAACSGERFDIEGKRGGHSGSEEGAQLIEHVLPYRLISV